MTGFDIIVIVIVGVAAIGGFMRGLVQEVLSLSVWFVAAFCIHYLHYPLYSRCSATLHPRRCRRCCFALLLLIPYIGMKIIGWQRPTMAVPNSSLSTAFWALPRDW